MHGRKRLLFFEVTSLHVTFGYQILKIFNSTINVTVLVIHSSEHPIEQEHINTKLK